MTIQAVVAKAQSLIAAQVTAIEYAPAYPTDKRLASKTSLAYATNISFEAQSAGMLLTFFDLHIQIMVPRKDLQDAMQFLVPLPEAIAAVFIADPTIDGTCQTYNGNITAQLITETIDGMTTVGYELIVPRIKMG
jgi:hypothetical protein